MRFLLIALIRLYRRHMSAHTGIACGFRPTCSAYAEGALHEHGTVAGLRLGWRRLRRCRGDHATYDPVPLNAFRARP